MYSQRSPDGGGTFLRTIFTTFGTMFVAIRGVLGGRWTV
jgi:hypothetical protein